MQTETQETPAKCHSEAAPSVRVAGLLFAVELEFVEAGEQAEREAISSLVAELNHRLMAAVVGGTNGGEK